MDSDTESAKTLLQQFTADNNNRNHHYHHNHLPQQHQHQQQQHYSNNQYSPHQPNQQPHYNHHHHQQHHQEKPPPTSTSSSSCLYPSIPSSITPPADTTTTTTTISPTITVNPLTYKPVDPVSFEQPPNLRNHHRKSNNNNNNNTSKGKGKGYPPHHPHNNHHHHPSSGCRGGGGGHSKSCKNGGVGDDDEEEEEEEEMSAAELQRRVARLTSYLYGMAVTVIVGGLLMVALVAALYAKLSHDVRHHSHQPKVGEQISRILEREELCVRCSEVRLGPSPDEEAMLDVFTKRESRDGLRCCVERPAELLRLLELHIEKRYRQEMAKGNIKIRHSSSGGRGRTREQEKPSAHLMGYPQRQDHNQAPGRQFPIGLWIHEEDLAFTHHVTYRHGRLVVPEDGLYYVYSQVAFLEVIPIGASSNPAVYTTESPSLSHYLYRYNIIYPNGGEEKLVQNSITKCWGPNKAFGEYTSYLGSVFHLRQGDEVFVKVSNVTMMARDPKSNYFGLFRV